MGTALTPVTAQSLKRGTVIATFNRTGSNPSGGQGLYENRSGGNHTAIFLSYFKDNNGKEGIWVIEQGPAFRPRGRQIHFGEGGGYLRDASYYNVVNICDTPFYTP
jgi:hypothetical protein